MHRVDDWLLQRSAWLHFALAAVGADAVYLTALGIGDTVVGFPFTFDNAVKGSSVMVMVASLSTYRYRRDRGGTPTDSGDQRYGN